MKVQLTSGSIYEVEEHILSGKRIMTRYSGAGTVVGIRSGMSGRRRNAFVIQLGKTLSLASRVNFTVLN